MSVTKVPQPDTNGLSLPPCLAPSQSDLDSRINAVSKETFVEEGKEDEEFHVVSQGDYSAYVPPESPLQLVIKAIFNSVSYIFRKQKPIVENAEPRHVSPEPEIPNGVKDPHFQANVASSFLKEGNWDLKALKKQINRDLLGGFYIQINGKHILSFEQLCKELETPESPFEFSTVMQNSCAYDDNEAYYYMSMLQQGATMDLFLHPRPHLIGDSTELHLLPFAPNGHLRGAALQIIEKANKKDPSASQLYQTACEQYSDLPRYLASAISLKVLDEKFLPNWESIKDPLPLFPTQFQGTYTSGATPELTIHQYLQLAKITDEIQESRLVHLTIRIEFDKPAQITWELV